MLDIREDEAGVTFRVRVQPRASKNQVAGVMEGALRLRLTAPPVDGEANKACLKFLAGLLGVALNSVELLTGHTGRSKTVRVSGVTAKEVESRITAVLEVDAKRRF